MKLTSNHVIKWYSATLGVAAGAVVYTYFGFGPVILVVLAYAAASYFSLAALRRTDEHNNPYEKLSEGIAAVGMVLFLPLIFLVDSLVALVVFLGFAQLALNLQTYDYRRFYVGMLVSLSGICVGATEATSGFYLAFFLVYIVLASLTIGYAYMAQRQGDEMPHWDWTDRTRVSLMMLALALGIYLILPRFPAGGFLAQPGSDHFYYDESWEEEAQKNEFENSQSQGDEIPESRSGGHNSDSPGDLEGEMAEDSSDGDRAHQQGDFDYKGFDREFEINNPDEQFHRFSNRIVARMRADNPQYLRARIFDHFDGLHWRTSSDRLTKVGVGFGGVDLVPPERYASSEVQTYEVYIEHDLGDYVPAAAVPVKLMFPATAIGVDIFGQITSPGALKKGTAYAVTSQYNQLRGRLFAELDHEPLSSYTQLPDDLDPRIIDLADKIAQNKHSELDAAIAMERHLRTQYQYDLSSALASQGRTPLSEFLFEKKIGHCEYFASALAVMLRTQKIPTRLVTGFSATNRNPLTGYYDIYALDGHAWVEAYVDHQGWVILEPTAYYDGPQPEEQSLSATQINEYVEHQVKQQRTLDLEDLTIEAVLNAAWQLFYVLFRAGLAYVKLFFLGHWHWLAAVAAAGLGGWFAWRHYRRPWMAFRIQRRVIAYRADQPDTAVNFYLNAIEGLLHLAGFEHAPGRTIERYLAATESIAGGHRDPAMADLFNRIYYNSDAGEQGAVKDYKQLFQDIYGVGIRQLQAMAKTDSR